jgi:hypothetical protein
MTPQVLRAKRSSCSYPAGAWLSWHVSRSHTIHFELTSGCSSLVQPCLFVLADRYVPVRPSAASRAWVAAHELVITHTTRLSRALRPR